MKIVHVTDTHLGIDRWYRGAPVGWRRADDHLEALRMAVAPALEGKVDVVLHTGDLFDRSQPPPRVVADVHTLLAEVGRRVPVILLPGNHDRRGLTRHFPVAIPGVHVHDAPGQVDVAGVRLAVVPFFRDAGTWSAAAGLAWSGGADLLLAHQAFHGSKVPGITFRAGVQADTVGARHLPRGARLVACGHIHPRQVVRVGEAEVVFPGSSERTAFTERGEAKGVVHWTFGRSVTWEWVDLPTRPMRVVEAPADVGAVCAGELVHLRGEARTIEVEAAAIARGGWVDAWAYPTGQLKLFG
jgi:DNA repair exonuclease SbcCD nuclease subunit